MNHPIVILFLSIFIKTSSSIECYGGDVEVGDLTEKYVDYNCPSLMNCFIELQEQRLAGENETILAMKKGCVEKADEEDFDNAPSCFNFDFSNSSAQFLTHGFKCTCNKSFCNGHLVNNINTSPAIILPILVFLMSLILS